MRETFDWEPNKEPATAETMEMYISEFTRGLKEILAAEESGFLSVEDQKRLGTENNYDRGPRPAAQVIKTTFMDIGLQFRQECQTQIRETFPEDESQMREKEKALAMLDLVDYFYNNVPGTSDQKINSFSPKLIQKIKEFFNRFPNT